MQAQCQCGQLQVETPEQSENIVACHCIDCQRRSGSPFGTAAYYPTEVLRITGISKMYTRKTAKGGEFRTHFCPECGATVHMDGDTYKGMTGIPVGAFANPDFPPPARSVWEQAMHQWVRLDCTADHYQQGRS